MTIDGFDAYLEEPVQGPHEEAHGGIGDPPGARTLYHHALLSYGVPSGCEGVSDLHLAKFGNLGLTSLASKIFEVGERRHDRMLEIAFDYPIHLLHGLPRLQSGGGEVSCEPPISIAAAE